MVKGLSRMFALVRQYPGRLRLFLIISLLYAAAASSFVRVIKDITHILQTRTPPQWMVDHFPGLDFSEHRAFYCILAMTVVLLFFKCAFQYGRRYLQGWLTQAVVLDTQRTLANHLLTLDLGYLQQERAGELLSRLTNDLAHLGSSVKLFCVLLTRPVTMVGFIAWIFYLDWRLALLGMIGAPLGGIVISILSRKMRRASKQAQEKRADLTSVMVQFLLGITTVKAFACEDFERRQFDQENRRLFGFSMKRERARALTRPVVEFLSSFGAMAALAIGGGLVMSEKIGLDDFNSFLAALGMMYQPAKELSNANNQLQESLPGAERVFELMDLQPSVIEGETRLGNFREGLQFENVRFAYKPETTVLRDINLHIKRGECVALVGPTASGKTTLATLLLRFFDLTDGRITIDGTDIRRLTFDSLRQHIAIVSQDPFLFNTTIRENIAYGRTDATSEAVEAAAMAAAIHDEIIAMPDGYNSIVGERGGNLSGGQRQRIAIARALFKDAPILVLDEATSALDAQSEKKVQTALDHLMTGRTSIVIAHRLSTVRHANRIVVLEAGRITAQGTHDELLAASPLYARAINLQGGGFLHAGDNDDDEDNA